MRCSFHASLASSTEARQRGQYIQLAGAGQHLEQPAQAVISDPRIAKPIEKVDEKYR